MSYGGAWDSILSPISSAAVGQTLPPITKTLPPLPGVSAGAGIFSAPTVEPGQYNPVTSSGAGSDFLAGWSSWYDSASKSFAQGAAKFAANGAMVLVLVVLLFVMLNTNPADIASRLPSRSVA